MGKGAVTSESSSAISQTIKHKTTVYTTSKPAAGRGENRHAHTDTRAPVPCSAAHNRQHWEHPARPCTGERQTPRDPSVHWIPLSNKWGRTTDTRCDITNLKSVMLRGRSESQATAPCTIPSHEMSRKGKSMETKAG